VRGGTGGGGGTGAGTDEQRRSTSIFLAARLSASIPPPATCTREGKGVRV
jgi:hypothetical protein